MIPGQIERFTPQARRVLAVALQEALRRRHQYITTEHLLLGIMLDIMPEGDNIAAQVLHDLGVEAAIRSRRTGWYSDLSGTLAEGAQPELAEETRQALRLAVKVLHQLNHPAVGNEHLLLGMTQLEESGAVQLLKRLNISVQAVTDQVQRRLIEQPPHTTRPIRERRIPETSIRDLADALLPEQYHRIVFTEDVLKAIGVAHEVACKHQHEVVNPEHLLLGVAQGTQSIAAQVLAALHLRAMKIEHVLLEVDRTTPTTLTEPLFLSPRTTAVFDQAIEEARPTPPDSVGTEHLLSGLLPDPTVSAMLRRLHTDPETVRGQVALTKLKRRWTTLHELPAPLPRWGPNWWVPSWVLPEAQAVHKAQEAHVGKLPKRGIAIYVDGWEEPLIAVARDPLTLGRHTELPSPDPTDPDLIDLTAYDAYRMGVSRRHAVLTFKDNRLYISDVGSANGTYLNGQRLVVYESYALQSGDELRLGKLKISIYS